MPHMENLRTKINLFNIQCFTKNNENMMDCDFLVNF